MLMTRFKVHVQVGGGEDEPKTDPAEPQEPPEDPEIVAARLWGQARLCQLAY